jgi:hypothetical protein
MDDEVEAELFEEFAAGGSGRGLAGFDLAAGGEPEAELAFGARDDEVDEQDAAGGVEEIDASGLARADAGSPVGGSEAERRGRNLRAEAQTFSGTRRGSLKPSRLQQV